MAGSQSKTVGKPAFNYKRWIVIGVIIVLFVICHLFTNGTFLRLENIQTIFEHSVYAALLAWGLGFIFGPGMIDMSLGANMVFSANIGAFVATEFGLGYPGLIIVTIVCCVLLEHVTMRVGLEFKLPSWIAGLCMAMIYEACTAVFGQWYSKSHAAAIPRLPDELRWLGSFWGGVALVLVGVVIAYFLFNRTFIGINVRALGDNEQVAAAMGINKKKAVYLASAIGAVFCAFAVLRQISYSAQLNYNTGLGSIQTIFLGLATFLLAAAFNFVAPMPITILIFSFVMQALFTFLTLKGVPTGTGQNVVLGAVVILCGILANRGNKGVVK